MLELPRSTTITRTKMNIAKELHMLELLTTELPWEWEYPWGFPYPWDGNGNGKDFFPVGIPIGIPIGIPMGYSNTVSLGHP